jgi:hypothetical protein
MLKVALVTLLLLAGQVSSTRPALSRVPPATTPQRNESSTEQRRNYEAWLAWSTVALVGFTAVLAAVSIWQGRLARKEFISTFRPRLNIRGVAKVKREGENVVEYTISNSGGSPAIIIDTRIALIFKAKGQPIPTRPFEGITDVTGKISLEAGESRDFDWKESSEDLTMEMADAFSAESDLLILGLLVYRDKLGTERRSAFCRMHDQQTGRFRTLEDPDYEYAD